MTTQGQTGNPVADELIGLSPGAKAALSQGIENHLSSTASAPDAPVPGMIAANRPGSTSAPPSQSSVPGAIPLNPQPQSPTAVPGMIQTPGMSENYETPEPQAAPGMIPISVSPRGTRPTLMTPPDQVPGAIQTPPHMAPKSTPGQDEFERLRRSGSGISQIHNPWARVPLQILDAIGGTFTPGLEQRLPGTQGHHEVLTRQAEGQAKEEQGAQSEQDKSRLTNAQAANDESLPDLHKAQAELNAEKVTHKNDLDQANLGLKKTEEQRKADQGQATIDQHLAAAGMKRDDQGHIVPQSYDEMSEPLKAVHDLKASQQELADARAAYAKAQGDNIPAAQELAKKRIDNATANAHVAAGRLGLSRDQFEAEFLGTHNGEALPGGPTTESGAPVGLKVAGANKPTGAAASRAAQAGSVLETGEDLKKYIDQHKDKLGNLGSYWSNVVNNTPISDPDISEFSTKLQSYAALQAAMHGFRGSNVMQDFEKAIGGAQKNPEAIKRAIDGIASTAKVVQKQGGSHSGGGPTPASAPPQRPKGVPPEAVFNPSTRHWEAP